MSEPLTIRTDGLTMAYRAWGDPDAPPLVLLHGLTSSSESWQAVAMELSADWRVYAPDARGHGGTDWTAEYSFALMGADLAAFCVALDLRQPVVIGHSMGGVAAYLYAHRFPGRVGGLVLAETPPPKPIARPVPSRPLEPLTYDFDARLAVLAQLAAPDPRWWENLAEIAVPSLVIGGGPESHFSQELMAPMAERIPDSEFVTIPVGHGLHGVRPSEFNAVVARFLTRLRTT